MGRQRSGTVDRKHLLIRVTGGDFCAGVEHLNGTWRPAPILAWLTRYRSLEQFLEVCRARKWKVEVFDLASNCSDVRR